ncbi:MAG: hypothetical protein RXO24_09565 [Acidilobus sp.]
MSEKEQAPGTALLKLFDDAVEAYDSVLWMASAAGLKDLEKTVTELLRRLLANEGHISGYATMVANIYKISAAVAGRRADERKVRRLLYDAMKLDELAKNIKEVAMRRDSSIYHTDYPAMAKVFMKGLLEGGENLRAFYKKVRALVNETARLSQELLSEASDNLAAVGVLPRKRVLEVYEENQEGLESVPDISQLSEPVNDDKGGKADK